MIRQITSRENPGLKAVRALIRSGKARQEASAFVTEGVRAVRTLFAGDILPSFRLKEIWISDKAAPEPVSQYEDKNIPVFQIEHALMEKLSDCRTSQGVLGVVHYTPEPLSLDSEGGNYLLLDGIRDPGNLGTLIRSAVAFGFAGVFLHGDTADVFNPKTVRAAMGSLPFCRHWETGNELFPLLKEKGYQLISTVLRGGESPDQMEPGFKNVLVIGNEAHGVSETIENRAACKISIPMSGAVESLNAAVAGSICMFSMAARTASLRRNG